MTQPFPLQDPEDPRVSHERIAALNPRRLIRFVHDHPGTSVLELAATFVYPVASVMWVARMLDRYRIVTFDGDPTAATPLEPNDVNADTACWRAERAGLELDLPISR